MIRELGDIDPKYLSHADLDSIEVLEDGTLNSESVAAAANKFRKENPLLIPSDDAGNITDTAALNGAPVQTGQKAYSEMTPEEKIDFMTNAPSLKDKS